MKKQLLTLAFAAISTLSFAQFTVANNGATFTGNTAPAASSQGQFYSYMLNYDTYYIDNTCSTAGSTSTVGGFDPQIQNSPDVGVIYYGGGIRTTYGKDNNGNCNPVYPSLGFYTQNSSSGGITTGTAMNLSNPLNQVLKFTYKSDADLNFELQLFDKSYDGKLTTVPVAITGDNALHSVTIDFSGKTQAGKDLTAIKQVSFVYTSETKSPNFGFSIGEIKIGGVVAAVNPAAYMLNNAVVYPNPASTTATLSMELKSNANVKVVISDLMGREMKVIANGNFASTTETFSVADLAQGLYKVTYLVDGAPAQTQSLMVK